MVRLSVRCARCRTVTDANPTVLMLYKFRCYTCGLEADLRFEAEQIVRAEDALKKLRDADVSLSVELKIKEV